MRPWTKGVFKLSKYALESLENALAEFDAGIFLLAPDDLASIRRRSRRIVRDNVIFELGLFVGALGRERTFLVAPKGVTRLHLPTDFEGLMYAGYGPRLPGESWRRVLEPACSEIRQALRDFQTGRSKRRGLAIQRVDNFSAFTATFDTLLTRTKTLTTFFIHSRRWRENHIDSIRRFLQRRGSRWIAFLPKLKDETVYRTFKRNFEDGPRIPTFVRDAYEFFDALAKEFPRQVEVRAVSEYPTYSFYILDRTIVIAMYPTTARKKSVPSFQIALDSEFGAFVKDDLSRLLKGSRRVVPRTKA